jgi:hypothetical protein
MSTASENRLFLGPILLSPPSLEIDFEERLVKSTILKNINGTNKFMLFVNVVG